MVRFAPVLALGFALCAVSACTDWDVGVNGNIAVSNDPRQVADVDHTGLVWWETQGTTAADAGNSDDTADAVAAEDAVPGSDDVLVVEILGGDVPAVDDVAADGWIAPDGGLDAGNTNDAADPCTGSNRPIGCACTNSQACASGLCVYGPTGMVCSPSCKDVVCPAGWTCTLPALVCKLMPDSTSTDVTTDDANAPDAVNPDDATPDGQAVDAAPDAFAVDVSQPDAGTDDASLSDTALQDAPNLDIAIVDATDLDAQTGDDADATADEADVQVPDGQLVDAATTDATEDAGADVDTDGLTGLDWVGYPDASFPDDADIYGGAINSCLSLYLYQQETCGKNNPTAACIDSVASQGSLYANYLFEPVRACQDALCVDLCAAATAETCMNDCIGKNCPNQFLSCVSNDQHGMADCKATFSCAMGYPGKLLTIGAKCYANGTLDAQLQVGGLISCETKPNTTSCFQAIGDCYDEGAAATNTCAQTITCTQNCAGAQDCVWACLGKASPTGRKAVDALGNCMVTICNPKCNGDKTCSDACVGTDCATPFGNCMAN